MSYVNGFVAAVPTANRDAYIQMAKEAAVVFKEHGALKLVECWGVDVPDGETTSFKMAVKLQEGEVVVFSWIVWPSKEVADAAMQKVMEDDRLSAWNEKMPFDGKRMIYGGFDVVVEA